MKKYTCAVFSFLSAPIICAWFTTFCARADTTLTIDPSSPYGCLQNAGLNPIPMAATNSFTLPGISGTGTIRSSVPAYAPLWNGSLVANFYNYSIDLSHLPPAASHCVRLLIHFGEPQGCDSDEVWGDPGQIQSATLALFGDITFLFTGGCLEPGQPAVSFTMFSEAAPKFGTVTVIDDYVDPANGTTNEARISVGAVVPDIPPDPPPWLFVSSTRIPYAWFQGLINSNNPAPPFTNLVSGHYDFALQILDAPTNGLAVSQTTTQSVQVVNGLFNLPLPFEPFAFCDGSARWLNIGVRPSGLPAVQFTPIAPPLPITPTAQAFYAYTAGVVADLTPGQAVTSLNGLTDAITLVAGSGITVGTSGNAIVISAAVGSDRNIKTDFTTVEPAEILAKLAALPIAGWRYTNEAPGIRHVGPVAQDFKAAFGLGHDEKLIEYVDEQGVALAAIQGLNDKVETESQRSTANTRESDTRLRKLEAENTDLKTRLEKLEQLLNSKDGGKDDHPQSNQK